MEIFAVLDAQCCADLMESSQQQHDEKLVFVIAVCCAGLMRWRQLLQPLSGAPTAASLAAQQSAAAQSPFVHPLQTQGGLLYFWPIDLNSIIFVITWLVDFLCNTSPGSGGRYSAYLQKFQPEASRKPSVVS